ncbi:MAG: phenylacetate--CoA ligase family protein [Deltaproteobacteria bacterium]|nr:phenylacetate--CoA ligase family protein [Deltaproteobacteria bacterium]
MELNGRARPAEPFDRLDTLTPAALRRWWTKRLRGVLETAMSELPFYRSRFGAAGFDAKEFRSLDDLRRLPTFRKRDMLGRQAELQSHALGIERRADGRVGDTLTVSSGTSGTTFLTVNPRWRRRQGRSSARAHWWAGFRPGSPFVISAPAWHAYAAIQPYLAEFFDAPCVVVSGTYLPRYADRIVDALRRFRPRYVTMFLPMVFPILAAARRMGLEPRALFDRAEVLLVTGAPITAGMERHLKEMTGVGRIAEVAGATEGVLAVSCTERSGLHVVPDTCYVEALDPQTREPVPAGRRGSMVHCFLIPEGSVYLRYDTEDVITRDDSPCACGLPSPRIKIVGRWEASFRLGGETVVAYDVQLALEEAVPETVGMPFVISREGLNCGKLRLLMPEPEARAAALAERIVAALAERFGAGGEVAWVRELPLQFKGVAPVLSETQVG